LNAWAFQKQAETKASWKDIVTQISWAFIGVAKLWWEKLSQENKDEIMDDADPLATSFTALLN
jgi:hypothetical protein